MSGTTIMDTDKYVDMHKTNDTLIAEVKTLREQLAIAVDALDDLQQAYDNWASVRKAHKALAALRAAGGDE